jgi:aspartyl-tRNA(Asn)/glutamyl-tRNA(Gln) amidotransferase subunit A
MDWGYAAVDPHVREIVKAAAEVFEKDLGCTVIEDNPGWNNPYNDFWTLVILETDLKGMRELDRKHPGKMSPHLSGLINRPWTAEDLTNAVIGRKHVVNCMWKFMQKYDFLLTPTLACPAFPVHTQGPEKIDGRMVDPFEWLHFTFPINMTGQPAASIPAGFTKEGLPVGLHIVGKHLDDPMVLRASAAFEMAKPWKDVHPPILKGLGLD